MSYIYRMDKKPTVLITGANGFIGSRLCREFSTRGFHIIAGVRPTANLELLNGVSIEYRYGDICDPATLIDMVKHADYIIHNAGLVKAKKDKTFFEVNERGTFNLLEAITQHNPKVKNVIYLSSLAVAGPSIGGRPSKENDMPLPITTYGSSKLAAERVIARYTDTLPILIIRPSGVYGPGDREILTIFQTVKCRIKPMFGDPERPIQLVHVDDLCRGVYLAAVSKAASGSVFFISENRAYTMSEMMSAIETASGKNALKLPMPGWLFEGIAAISELGFRTVRATPMLTREKANELLAPWSVSTDKARDVLGFESSIPFERGVKDTFDWYKERGWIK